MYSHITLGISDFYRSLAFYTPILTALGHEQKFSEPPLMAGWMPPGQPHTLFVICRPFDDNPASAGNGSMVAFVASHRDQVDQCHAAAIQNGGTSEGAPGLRPHYHADYYGAYFRDPDGNKICVACHEPA